MATDFKQVGTGEKSMMLACPVCSWYGEVWYNTKPPAQCSNACKQKAKRNRGKYVQEARERKARWQEIIDSRFATDRLYKRELVSLSEFFKETAFKLERTIQTGHCSRQEEIILSSASNIQHDLANFLMELAQADTP